MQARVVGALQMYLVEEFEDTVEQYQDDVENLLECKLQVAIASCYILAIIL